MVKKLRFRGRIIDPKKSICYTFVMDNTNLIGRTTECERLDKCMKAKQAQLIVVYGRRRVGKTYLINEYFNNKFAFKLTGVYGQNRKEQIQNFTAELNRRASKKYPVSKQQYLGRITENGLIPPKTKRRPATESSAIATKEYGASSVLNAIGGEIYKKLKERFPQDADRIFTLAALRVIERCPFKRASFFI